jgi:hypothetical protein
MTLRQDQLEIFRTHRWHVILPSATARVACISCPAPNATSPPYTSITNCHEQTRSKCLSFKVPCLTGAKWKRQRNLNYSIFWRQSVLVRICEKQVLAYNIHPSFLTYSMEQSLSWEVNLFFCQSRNSPHFMEPEGSLPHSQVSATCPYPDLDRFSPYTHIPLPEDLS